MLKDQVSEPAVVSGLRLQRRWVAVLLPPPPHLATQMPDSMARRLAFPLISCLADGLDDRGVWRALIE